MKRSPSTWPTTYCNSTPRVTQLRPMLPISEMATLAGSKPAPNAGPVAR